MAALSYSFKVRTYCATFNHENYIIDALKGFAMQQTTFPVVYTIVDDASTDGTAAVIKKFVSGSFDLDDDSVGYEKDTEYGHVTFARHKTNKNCFFAVIYLKENHYSQKKSKAPYLTEWMDTKYVALCEGDDYWIDPMKLQKQVDYLETHEEYSMCFHGAKVLNECEARLCTDCSSVCDRDYSANDIFSAWIVPTASVVYRREIVDSFQMKHYSWFVYGDIVLFEKCAHVGKVRGFSKTMSVYRMNANSMVQNSKYIDDKLQKMPFHFRALKLNFDHIDKKTVREKITDSYYAKMRNDKRFVDRIVDFCCFVGYSPFHAISKILMKINIIHKH